MKTISEMKCLMLATAGERSLFIWAEERFTLQFFGGFDKCRNAINFLL